MNEHLTRAYTRALATLMETTVARLLDLSNELKADVESGRQNALTTEGIERNFDYELDKLLAFRVIYRSHLHGDMFATPLVLAGMPQSTVAARQAALRAVLLHPYIKECEEKGLG